MEYPDVGEGHDTRMLANFLEVVGTDFSRKKFFPLKDEALLILWPTQNSQCLHLSDQGICHFQKCRNVIVDTSLFFSIERKHALLSAHCNYTCENIACLSGLWCCFGHEISLPGNNIRKLDEGFQNFVDVKMWKSVPLLVLLSCSFLVLLSCIMTDRTLLYSRLLLTVFWRNEEARKLCSEISM